MSTTTMVHVRIDETIKNQATDTLAAMGLSLSDAVRVFLTRVVAEQQIPFAIKVPNATTQAAMQEAREILTARRTRFSTLEAMIEDLDQHATPSKKKLTRVRKAA
jgi:DNA-damage-inducible protein J